MKRHSSTVIRMITYSIPVIGLLFLTGCGGSGVHGRLTISDRYYGPPPAGGYVIYHPGGYWGWPGRGWGYWYGPGYCGPGAEYWHGRGWVGVHHGHAVHW